MNQPARRSSEQPPPQPQQKPKLRWFQFGMRSLFIVMTLVCVGLGWLIHHVREQEAVGKMIRQNGGYFSFGEPSFLGRMGVVRSLFGEHAFAQIETVTLIEGATDSHLLPLKKLKKLRRLVIQSTQVSDLSPLAGLSELTSLILIDTPVTDLSPLAGMKGLEWLDLESTQVSDLSPLAGLKNLHFIYLEQDQKVLIPASLEKAVIRL